MSEQPPGIAWVPVLDTSGEDLERMHLHTFGMGGDHPTVPVAEAGGAPVDVEIAELVALLNRAGVTTFQACQDIEAGFSEIGPLVATVDDDYLYFESDRDAVRFGCIVVEWDQFPRTARILPERRDGWLFSATN